MDDIIEFLSEAFFEPETLWPEHELERRSVEIIVKKQIMSFAPDYLKIYEYFYYLENMSSKVSNPKLDRYLSYAIEAVESVIDYIERDIVEGELI